MYRMDEIAVRVTEHDGFNTSSCNLGGFVSLHFEVQSLQQIEFMLRRQACIQRHKHYIQSRFVG